MMASCDVGDKGKRDDRAVLVDRQVHALRAALLQGLWDRRVAVEGRAEPSGKI